MDNQGSLKVEHLEPDPEDPLVAVLLLEQGGEMCNQVDDKDSLVNGVSAKSSVVPFLIQCLYFREDVELVLWDLVHTGVVNDDFRMANIVRAPSTAKFCRHHERVHRWNIIDFDRAWVVDLSRE